MYEEEEWQKVWWIMFSENHIEILSVISGEAIHRLHNEDSNNQQ